MLTLSTTVLIAVRSTRWMAISGVSGEPSLTSSRAISSRRVSVISSPPKRAAKRSIKSSDEQPGPRKVSIIEPVSSSLANSELLGT
ncbi:hypothetical protein D3C81_1922320 [compost metagenome]